MDATDNNPLTLLRLAGRKTSQAYVTCQQPNSNEEALALCTEARNLIKRAMTVLMCEHKNIDYRKESARLIDHGDGIPALHPVCLDCGKPIEGKDYVQRKPSTE